MSNLVKRPATSNGGYQVNVLTDFGKVLQFAGGTNVTMCPAALAVDKTVTIQKYDGSSSGAVTIYDPAGHATIGACNLQNNAITYVSDGVAWWPTASF